MKSESNKPMTTTTGGFLRLPEVLKLIPVSRSTWWAAVASGRFPKPVKLGPRITAWRAEDIQLLIANGIPVKDAA